jgi:hypothetical protein
MTLRTRQILERKLRRFGIWYPTPLRSMFPVRPFRPDPKPAFDERCRLAVLRVVN